MLPHDEFVKEEFNKSFDEIEKMINDFREDEVFSENYSAMRAISVALTNLQTAHMWVNKAIYAPKTHPNNEKPDEDSK